MPCWPACSRWPRRRRPRAATLTGVAFKDLDRDGAWQPSEPVLADQEIHLFAATGPYLARAVTDAFGRYAFSDLADGDYRVAYDAPSWWALRQDWVPTTTASLEPARSVSLSGTASADFGWRPIVRSTDPNAPISALHRAERAAGRPATTTS